MSLSRTWRSASPVGGDLLAAVVVGAAVVGLVARAVRSFCAPSAPCARPAAPPRRLRVSLALRNTVLWSPSADPLAPNYALVQGARSLLLRTLAQRPDIDLHVVTTVVSALERDDMLRLLLSSGLLDHIPLANVHVLMLDPRHKGQRADAKVNCIADIAPDLHIDGSRSANVVSRIAARVPTVMWVNRKRATRHGVPQAEVVASAAAAADAAAAAADPAPLLRTSPSSRSLASAADTLTSSTTSSSLSGASTPILPDNVVVLPHITSLMPYLEASAAQKHGL